MGISSVPVGWEDDQDESGCHAAYGSEAEADRLREVEAIAKVVGGRRSRDTAGPSRRFLKRLEEAARGSSWPDRS
jgi:hypothetical protein